MHTLALKLTVTPLLILAASLASRRWGESIGGWFVGLPLTSAPVCFFLALDQGADFAAAAGLGCLAGAAAEAGFCLGYGFSVSRGSWSLALAVASFAFALGVAAFATAALPLGPLTLTACAALAGALWLLPKPRGGGENVPAPPRWDIPVRMVVATGLVLGVTALAPVVGPRLSGLLTTYPIFAAVFTVFSHHARGPGAAIQVLRGLLIGLFGFIGFFAALTLTLPRLGIAGGFAIATVIALVIQAGSLRVLRRG
jgi:hypothetical protein